jgi:hypothetical protein
VRDEVDEFFEKEEHVDALGDDEPEIKRQLQPSRAEDQ